MGPVSPMSLMQLVPRIQVVDSHTGGEPTRVVIAGGPELATGSMAGRLVVFRERYDGFRSAIINEPRGSDILVGALLCEPLDPTCAAGAIFFNNVGCLGMCGHGTMGVAVTLAHLGRIGPGRHRLETPVGVVTFELQDKHKVTVENVPSYRHLAGVSVEVERCKMKGDVAWGGNWFFLTEDHHETLDVSNVERLTVFTWAIRQALHCQGITGRDGAEIDHVELFGPAVDSVETAGLRRAARQADSRNFVLCPGKAYDRSPCGTGTSAKLACLFADGKLREGEVWVQESIIGSQFEGKVVVRDGQVVPIISGTAYVTAEATLLFEPADPFASGIPK